MEQPTCRTLALEFLAKQSCIVMYQGSQTPSDAAWDMHLEQFRSLAGRLEEIKILVITEGGRPTKAQQARLAQVVGGHASATAVVSAMLAVRFVVSALALVKPNLRYFTPDEMGGAFQHLGIEEEERTLVLQTIERLRRHVHPTQH